MRLSVVVPTYRAPAQLQALLRSLAVQQFDPAQAEIIVVDDGSPDFDAGAFAGLAGAFPLTILAQRDNGGRAVARNAGIRAARGDIVVFLDGDMTAEAGFLQAHADFHQAHSNAAAVGAIAWAPEVPDTPFMRYAGGRGVGRFTDGPVPYKCFVTGNSSVPRKALLDVDGFDEMFSTYGGEDLELGYRLHLAGLLVYYAPKARSLHFGWKGMRGMRASMATYGSGSLPLLLGKHPELVDVLRLDFLSAPRWQPKRMALLAALWPAVHAPVYGLARLGEALGYVPALVFDYLWWYERTRAFLRTADDAG